MNGTHWSMGMEDGRLRLGLVRTDTSEEVAYFEAEMYGSTGINEETLVLRLLTREVDPDSVFLLMRLSSGAESRDEEADGPTRLMRRLVYQLRGNFVLFADLSSHELQTRVFGYVKDLSRTNAPKMRWRAEQTEAGTPIGRALSKAEDSTIVDTLH